jgi:amino acid transporter
LAILIAIFGVGLFYVLFTLSVYHIVPWSYVASQAQTQDITAPGLLSLVLPKGVDILILAGAAIALINDLPAMLLIGFSLDVCMGKGRHLSACHHSGSSLPILAPISP